MNILDAMCISFDEVKLFHKAVLFSEMRIDINTLPKGMYLYELRYADFDQTDPCQLAKGILVNFYGTIISNKKIRLDKNGLRDFSTEKNEFLFVDSNGKTINEYLEIHPLKEIKVKER